MTTHHHDGGNYTEHFIVHLYLHAREPCTHLFLNPNDVKGLPLKLQLANISPAKNHGVALLMHLTNETDQPS